MNATNMDKRHITPSANQTPIRAKKVAKIPDSKSNGTIPLHPSANPSAMATANPGNRQATVHQATAPIPAAPTLSQAVSSASPAKEQQTNKAAWTNNPSAPAAELILPDREAVVQEEGEPVPNTPIEIESNGAAPPGQPPDITLQPLVEDIDYPESNADAAGQDDSQLSADGDIPLAVPNDDQSLLPADGQGAEPPSIPPPVTNSDGQLASTINTMDTNPAGGAIELEEEPISMQAEPDDAPSSNGSAPISRDAQPSAQEPAYDSPSGNDASDPASQVRFTPEANLEREQEENVFIPPIRTGQNEQEIALAEQREAELIHPPLDSSGQLIVQVSTAMGAVPVRGARVMISLRGEAGEELYAFDCTDNNGRTRNMTLPAPDQKWSEQPEPDILPFALYDIKVQHEAFYSVEVRDVQLFGGQSTLQQIRMIPLPDFSGPQTEVFTVIPQNL